MTVPECPAGYVCKYDIHPIGVDVLEGVLIFALIVGMGLLLIWLLKNA